MNTSKVRLLAKAMAASRAVARPSPVHRLRMSGEGPLSINQESRFFAEWIHARSGRVLPQLNNVVCLRLKGQPNTGRIKEVLAELARRNPVLRSSFRTAASGPSTADSCLPQIGQPHFRQSVADPEGVQIVVNILEARLAVEDQSWNTVGRRLIDTTFDYSMAPLVRGAVLCGEDYSLLLLAVSHLLLDREAWTLLQEEFRALYAAAAAGLPAPPAESRMDYIDFAVQQREAAKAGAFEEGVHYWFDCWEDLDASHISREDLPLAVPSAAERVWRPRPEICVLDAAFTVELLAFARAQGLTPHMVITTALSGLLHAYTRRNSICVWGHFSNRHASPAKRVVGWVANSHFLKVSCAGNLDWLALANRVKAVLVGAIANQSVPPALVFAEYLRKRGRFAKLYSDLYISVDCVVDAGEPAAEELVERVDPPTLTNAGLELVASFRPNGGTLSIYYSGSQFSARGVRTILLDLRLALATLASDSGARVSGLLGRRNMLGGGTRTGSGGGVEE